MARTKVKVDKKKLRESIEAAEASEKFSTRTKLWERVAEIYNANNNPNKPLTSSVVQLRVKEFNLIGVVKTPKGKRGSGLKHARAQGKINRRSRAEKFQDDPEILASLREIRKAVQMESGQAERFLPIVEKIEAGSMSNAVKAKCLDCSNYATVEIRKCPVKACALWPFRPYKPSANDTSEEDDND